MRMRRQVVAAAALGAALGLLASGAAARAGETIRINGSGAPLQLMAVLSEAYAKLNPGVQIVIEKPLGSSGAIKAVMAGALDLAVSSKPLTPEQGAQGAVAQEFGRTPLVLVTEKSVRKTDITTSELEQIYRGALRSWPNGVSIRVVLRPQSDVDTTILRGLSPGMAAAIEAAQSQPGMLTAVTDPESDDAVARTPGALGASALCSLLVAKPALNALTLNGVPASIGTLADRTYPLAKEIRFVTKGAPAPGVAAFLAFVTSPRGRALAEESGVLLAAEARPGRIP
jgi:phosphate transport system substrate-binding protein